MSDLSNTRDIELGIITDDAKESSASAAQRSPETAPAAKKPWYLRPRWITRIIIIATIIALSNTKTFSLSDVKRGYTKWVQSFEPYPLAPLVLYAIFSALFCAFSPIATGPTLLAGATFDVWYAVPTVYLFMNLAPLLNLLLIRYTGLRAWIYTRYDRAALLPFPSFDKLIAFDPVQTVAVLRTPYLGSGSRNYAFSLSDIPIKPYIIGNLIGLFPGAILFTVLGAQLNTYIDMITGRASVAQICVFVLVIVVVVVGVYVSFKTIKHRFQLIGARMRRRRGGAAKGTAATASRKAAKKKPTISKTTEEHKAKDDDDSKFLTSPYTTSSDDRGRPVIIDEQTTDSSIAASAHIVDREQKAQRNRQRLELSGEQSNPLQQSFLNNS